MDKQQVTVRKRKKKAQILSIEARSGVEAPAAAHAEEIGNRKHDKAQKRVSHQSGASETLPPTAIPPLSVCLCVCIYYLLSTGYPLYQYIEPSQEE